MKKTFTLATLFVATAAIMAGCGNQGNIMKKLQKDDFEKFNDCMLYKVTDEKTDGKAVAEGEIVLATASIRFNDSVLMPANGEPQPICMAGKAQNELDFSEVMIGRHVGETVTVALIADSVAARVGAQQMPPMYTAGAGDVMYYEFVIADAMTQEAMQASQQAKAEANRVADSAALVKYIADNNITAKPSKTGLYRIITQQGTGAKVADGKTVQVHYTGKLLNGEKFDSSYDRNEPISIVEGKHKVIPGWEEGLMGLPAGSTATLIIPSSLGYGAQGAGTIPPYSTLVFDVEVVSVK
ncbi:MAG: FKBP-type peptidyl-prolyl cis-trans isomerase [Bacteroidales bacterium]|nr:FKBP-type peptidyl-prolyl cis-trans isomerase [Bacteroidales bacterium]